MSCQHGPRPAPMVAISTAQAGEWDPPTRHYVRNLARLTNAARTAGVRLGAYDLRIFTWLTSWEPQTVEVVAAILDRAADATRRPGAASGA